LLGQYAAHLLLALTGAAGLLHFRGVDAVMRGYYLNPA
jgi:hypothetical protein